MKSTDGKPVALEVNVSLLEPAAGPSVQLVTVDVPVPSVMIALVGTTVPLPGRGVNVTPTPATGLPYWSVTFALGGIETSEPAVALWLSPALFTIVVAAP